MIELDECDVAILGALREDSRLPLRQIGERSGLTAPAVAARLKRLESTGVIKAYTLTVSDGAFGLECEGIFMVKVKRGYELAFLDYMHSALSVTSLYRIASEYEYLAIASFPDLKGLTAFLDYLKANFGETTVKIVLDKPFISRVALRFKDKGHNKDKKNS